MSNLGLGLLWMLCALWMVQEICALLTTNQIQSFSQVQFCHFFSPRFRWFACFYFKFWWVPCYISSVLMGYYECFGSGFTALSLKKLYKKANILNLCWQQLIIKTNLPQISGQFVFCQKKIPCTPILFWNFPWTISTTNKNGRGRNFSNNFWTFFLECLSFVMIMVQKKESQQIIRF